MKTPLTSIIGYSEYLCDTKYESAAFAKGMNYVHSEARRIEDLSNNLMRLMVLDEDELEFEKTDLAEVYCELEEWLAFRLEETGVVASEDIQDAWVLANPGLMSLVIVNLINNAVQAMPEGGELYVSIGVSEDERSAVLSVRDTGRGISPDKLAKVFKPFYVADDSRARSSGGTGLGLSICKTIVDKHGGTIVIASSLGKGTEVKVELPRCYNNDTDE